MQGVTYLVMAYAVIWLGLLAYVGWNALQIRGVRTELETVRDLLEERGQQSDGGRSASE
jgi:CcmD family protein